MAWLCAPDSTYLTYVESLVKADPTLEDCDYMTKNRYISSLHNRTATVTTWETSEHKMLEKTNVFSSLEDIQKYLRDARAAESTSPSCQRVYILEGLNSDLISLFGEHFKIGPAFFIKHERVSLWPGGTVEGQSTNLTRLQKRLPSTRNPCRNFCFSYCELRDFDPRPDSYDLRCADTARHIGATRWLGSMSATGIVRRKCSYWLSESDGPDKSQSVILLCDPPVEDVFVDGKIKPNYKNLPFQGGYVDFNKPKPPPSQNGMGPGRDSLRLDLDYYFHQKEETYQELHIPQRVVTLVSKITASHYLQFLDLVKAGLSHIEWKLAADVNVFNARWAQEQWTNIQSAYRRCNHFREDVWSIISDLEYGDDERRLGYDEILKDYRHIAAELDVLSHRAERLLNSMTGLAGIIDAMRTSEEAASMKMFTFLGIIFVPLAYVASLFGMNGEFRPGGKLHGVYWVVALLLLLIISLIVRDETKGFLRMLIKWFSKWFSGWLKR